MGNHDRFRGQDPDNEYSWDDETSSSMGGSDESSMQEQGAGDYTHGQDEFSSDMGGEGTQNRERRGRHAYQEEDAGGYDELPDDPGSNW